MFVHYTDAIMIIFFSEKEVGEVLRTLVTYITDRSWLINPAKIQPNV